MFSSLRSYFPFSFTYNEENTGNFIPRLRLPQAQLYRPPPPPASKSLMRWVSIILLLFNSCTFRKNYSTIMMSLKQWEQCTIPLVARIFEFIKIHFCYSLYSKKHRGLSNVNLASFKIMTRSRLASLDLSWYDSAHRTYLQLRHN